MAHSPPRRHWLLRLPLRFPATFALTVLTCLMFMLQMVAGGSMDLASQTRLGLAQPALIFEHGEWFRLFTPMFLHHGPVHLALNWLAFLQLGALTELMFGSYRMLTVYLVCGVASSTTSVMLMDSSVNGSLGASGAIMGLAGLLLGTSWFGEKMLRERLRLILGRRLLFGVLLTFGLGLLLLLVFPIVDNWGHFGGFAAGVLLAAIRPDPSRRPGRLTVWAGGAMVGVTASALLWMAAAGGASSSNEAMAEMYRQRAFSNPDGLASGLAATEMIRNYHEAGRPEESLVTTRELLQRCTEVTTPQMISMSLVETPYERETAAALDRWIALDPTDPDALNGMAWFMVTAVSSDITDPAHALLLSQRSLELLDTASGDDLVRRALFLDTQALAWFRLGNPERALQVQEQSTTLAWEAGIPLPDVEHRIAVYTAAVAERRALMEQVRSPSP